MVGSGISGLIRLGRCLRCRVLGLGFRVQGLGFRVLSPSYP